MNIFISPRGFKLKPTGKQSAFLNSLVNKYIEKVNTGEITPFNTRLEYIAKKLKKGHTINTSILKDNIKMFIMDIDEGVSEEEFLQDLKKYDLKPNIYYKTFSHNEELGITKLRAIFKMDKGYTAKEYTEIYNMMIAFFPYLDVSLKSWRQLIHGTNKTVFYTGEEVQLKPTEFGIKNNWKPKPKEVKKVMKVERSKNYDSGDVESILKDYLSGSPFDYPEAREFYTVLKEFNLQDRLKLKDHHTVEKMENNPKYATKGSLAARLLGELRRANK
jgi:hypothetical protein